MFLEMIYHSCNLPFMNLERNVHINYIYVEHFLSIFQLYFKMTSLLLSSETHGYLRVVPLSPYFNRLNRQPFID